MSLACPRRSPQIAADHSRSAAPPRLWLPTSAPVAVPPRLCPWLRAGPGLPRWSYFPAPDAWPTASDWGPVTNGTVVALPEEFSREGAATLLHGIRHAVRAAGNLLLIHNGAGGGSLLATMRRELPVRSLTIQMPPVGAALSAAQALASCPPAGVHDLTVDADGLAATTAWSPAGIPHGACPLEPDDLVVVTGGLGGLGGAIAQRLSERLAIHPVLLDQADPAGMQARTSLAMLRASGRPFTQVPVDVTDAAAVRAALRIVTQSRPVRAVIHCAGLIDGGFVRHLDIPALIRLSCVKVDGLRAVLSAIDLRSVRVVIAFGSILARAPHPAVGAYALANELLRREVDRWASRAPGTRFLTAEWSIWDGAGVAAATGQVANARRAGYEPIPLSEGLRMVERLLAWKGRQTSVLVSATPPRQQ
jgi:NAD(P)-dependent dehydrogenase (short-subunit alcohol dehydrogenase family)